MSFRFDTFAGTDRTFPLRGPIPPITLDADGVRHPRSTRRPTTLLTRYEDVTHLAASARMLWIGTRESVYLIPRASFENFDAPERLIQAILQGIQRLPRGPEQLERIAAIEESGLATDRPRATWALIGICLAVYALQMGFGFEMQLSGHYSPVLVADGDVWRILTANLLHAPPGVMGFLHIGLNLIGLLALGILVERPLGTARTICVMGASGAVAMLASGWFGAGAVVGVSGVVFGLAGSVLWLDYRRAEQLPAWCRFPRRSLLILLAINGILGLLVPVIALGAHAGGFVAGALATAAVTANVGTRAPAWVRGAAVSVVGVTFLSAATAGMDAFSSEDITTRYAARFARLPGISPLELNDQAWLIAISADPSRAKLEAALLLAERAVAETDREEPTILDTLAEVLWQLGNVDAALATIDEAIARDPGSDYYREQRRRFVGERAPDDRPEYVPQWLRVPGNDPPPPAPASDTGLSV